VSDWPDTVAGFDRARWWCELVCSNRRMHAPQVVGIAFEHADGPSHIAPRVVQLENGSAWVAFAPQPLDEDQRAGLRDSRGALHDSLHGSWEVRCPNGCTPRVPRDRMDAAVAAARGASLDRVDVSAL